MSSSIGSNTDGIPECNNPAVGFEVKILYQFLLERQQLAPDYLQTTTDLAETTFSI
jgi:hypothetical protein